MVETKQDDVGLDVLSLGDESEGFSELEMPRSSIRKRMTTAIAGGTLPQLVLERSVDLGLAISKCFELLGIATNSEDEQRSAARSLVALCTHPDLRPAVDHLLVLRRLGRVVECTRAPAALGAALEALVAVADDAGWEDKGGVVAQLLRDGLCRCVAVIAAAVAAPSDDPASFPNLALAEAALASLDSARLRTLLSDAQLVEAGGAVSAFLVSAAKHGRVSTAALAALQLLLSPECWAERQSASDRGGWPVPEVLGQAVVGSGAVEPLLGLLAGSGETGNSKTDGPGNDQGVGLMALRCLRTSLLTCLRSSQSEVPSAVHDALAVPQPQQVVGALLPYLQHGEEAAAGLALDVLLVAVSCWSLFGVGAVVGAIAAADGQKWRADAGLQLGSAGQELCAALLRAADSVLKAPSPGLTHKLASALMEIVSGLCRDGLVAPDELLAQCPGVRDVVVGVLTGQAPGSSWAAVVMPPGAFAVSCAAGLDAAALDLLDQLGLRTSLHVGNGFGPEVACSLAGALVHALVGNQIAVGGSVMRWIKQLRCLARCLQAVPEQSGLWVADSVPVTAAPSRTQVTVRHMVQLVQQVSGVLSNKSYEAFAEELHEDALAAYESVLRAAAVLAKAAWATALDSSSYYQNHHHHSNTGTAAEGQQAVGRLLANVLSIACSNTVSLDVCCTANVLNAAVASLQPGLVAIGEGLAALPSVKALKQQQSGSSTLTPVSPAGVPDLRSQLNTLHYGYRSSCTTAKDVVAGIQGAHKRLLELVTNQVAAAAAAGTSAGDGAAGGGLAAVPAALRVATNAGQLLGHGLQAYC